MSESKAHTAEVRAALFELQRYLSDQVAPLMVADSIATLLKHPPQIAANEINSWIAAQYRGAATPIPLSDYLFHSIKKFHQLGEFNLLVEKRLHAYIEHLKQWALETCPAEDRELLKKSLEMMGERSSLATRVDVVHRQAGSETPLATATTQESASMRRMATLISRLRGAAEIAVAGVERRQIMSHAVMTAATTARTAEEMQESFDRVRELGIEADPARAFRLLSETLPSWAVPVSTLPPSDEWPDTAAPDPIVAMTRIVSIADDPAEAARRFRLMIEAAIERFNEGSLGRTVTMLELAERFVADKLVDDSTSKSVRRTMHDMLDQAKLRAYAETKDAHYSLRKILNFFTPFTPEGLLDGLEEEQRRDRRRTILAMLEVHGEEARRVALTRLKTFDVAKPDRKQVFFTRNLLYVLNRIPPAGEENIEAEIDLIAGYTAFRFPPLIMKESVAALGQFRHERAEKVLIKRLSDLEQLAVKPGQYPGWGANDCRQALDRVTLALGRYATGTAWRAIIDHGLRPVEAFGDTFARLAPLAAHDLSPEPDLIARINEAIRNEMPKKVLGFQTHKNNPRITKLVEALGGTPAPEVYEVLQEVQGRFPDQDFGQAAAKLLEAFGASKADEPQVAPSIAGDLEVLGLPNVLQTLGASGSTGVLTVYEPDGKMRATITMQQGRVVRAHCGVLRSKDAVFQLFEDGRPGTFAFIARPEPPKDDDAPLDVEPLIFEGVRRYDELREARLLVPENISLAPTGTKPVPHPGEHDPQLVREVWLRAASGAKPAEWKSALGADYYRIWRLLAHWTDTGALKPRADA